jgi:hypothetical protein
MAVFGRHLSLWLTAVVLLAPLAAPARAFFPPAPVYVPATTTKSPISVPQSPQMPPVITPPSVTPPGGGTGTPESNPEPTSLVLGLLGGAGVGLFAAWRRRRPG